MSGPKVSLSNCGCTDAAQRIYRIESDWARAHKISHAYLCDSCVEALRADGDTITLHSEEGKS